MKISFDYGFMVATRFLTEANDSTTRSLAKLTTGKRVTAARDDASSLAVGMRLRAEIAGLHQASTNISQAVSTLQIADGALGRIADILYRMKSLGVQASSASISTIDRAVLDREFDFLRSEIDRIAEDTTFGGLQLLSGVGTAQTAYTSMNIGASIDLDNGFIGFAFANDANNVSDGDVFRIRYQVIGGGATGRFRVENTTAAMQETIDIPMGSFGGALDVAVPLFDLTISLDGNFDHNTNQNGPPFVDYEFTVWASQVVDPLQLTYQVGTGVGSADEILVTLDSAQAGVLDSRLPSASLMTPGFADVAISAINAAIDKIAEMRASFGAGLNRLEFAAANLATVRENMQTARSGLLDLNVASEMTRFVQGKVRGSVIATVMSQAFNLRRNLIQLIDQPPAHAGRGIGEGETSQYRGNGDVEKSLRNSIYR